MLFASVVSTVVIRGSAALAGLLLTFVVARGSDIAIAGQFFFFIAIVNLLGLIATGGYSATALRELSKFADTDQPAPSATLAFFARRVATLASLFSICGILVLIVVAEGPPNNLVAIYPVVVWVSVCSISLAHLFSHSLQAFRSPKLAALLQKGMTSLLCVVFLLVLAAAISSVSDLMMAYALSCTVTILISLGCLAKSSPMRGQNLNKAVLDKARLTVTSRNLWTAVVASSLLQWGGVFALGIFVGPESVAQYSVAMRLALIYSMVLLSINSVFSPHFVEAHQRLDNNKLQWLIVISTRTGWLFGTVIVTALMLWAPTVTEIFGRNYSSETATILRILLLGQCANIAAGPVISVLNMTGNDAAVRDVALLSSCVLVAFCLALAPYYGAYGVAVASVASMCVHNVFAIVKLRRQLGFSTLIALSRVSRLPS